MRAHRTGPGSNSHGKGPGRRCRGSLVAVSHPGAALRLAVAIAGVALISSIAVGQMYVNSNGHIYALTSAPCDVHTARAQAAALGGHLVTINSAAENAFVVSAFGPFLTAHNMNAWIGLSDACTPGTFVWDSGEPIAYMNWMSGEPNNSSCPGAIFPGEDFAEIQLCCPTNLSYGKWNDVPSPPSAGAPIQCPGGSVCTATGGRFGIIEVPSYKNPNNGHLYAITATVCDVHTARASAATLGGHLVAINSAAENTFVVGTFGPLLTAQNMNAWIGLSDACTPGTFVWDSGEPAAYMNWMPGEPSNSPCPGAVVPGEDFAEIQLCCPTNASYGKWNDVPSPPSGGAPVQCPGGGVCTATGGRFGIIEIPYVSPGCSGTTPQPNSSTASLVVNGVGGPSSLGLYPVGPFFVTIPTSGPDAWRVAFSWTGPPGSALVIVTGALAPCSIDMGCSGRLDIALPGLGVLFDGTLAPLSLLFTTGATGTATQSFTLPALPPGPVIDIQGGVIQPGCFAPVVLTAAFRLSI